MAAASEGRLLRGTSAHTFRGRRDSAHWFARRNFYRACDWSEFQNVDERTYGRLFVYVNEMLLFSAEKQNKTKIKQKDFIL